MDNPLAKILIVDDKPSNLRFLSKILIEQGYKVRRAISGQLAINGALDAPPDLILLDIIMPHMDGYEVCRRLKANPVTGKIPVIFLSALTEVADKIRAFEVGGVDYIPKPFQVAEVLARIDNQLTLQTLAQQLQRQNAQLQREVDSRKQAEIQLQHKSDALADFSAHLKQLHRLHTSHYDTFETLFADYLRAGCEILGLSTGIISQICDREALLHLRSMVSKQQSADRTYTILAVQSDLDSLAPNQCFDLGDTYCAAVVNTGQTVAYARVGTIPAMQHHPVYQNLRLESYIGTPISVKGEIYGTLNFSSQQTRPHDFATQEREIIELMAQSLGKFIAAHQTEAKRQQAEIALQKREHYLSTLVKVQRQLLANSNPNYAQILQLLGETAGADRVYLFENHRDEAGNLLMSQRFEWCKGDISPQIANPDLQNLAYRDSFPRWAEVLGGGEAISGRVADFPPSEREILAPQGILSILVFPLQVQGQFFGFIGFDNCTQARLWEPSEVALLRSAAAAMALKQEQLHHELALAESEERFRTMADSTAMLLWVSDASGRQTFFNKTWLEFTGRTLEEELALGGWENIHPDDRVRCQSIYLTALEAKESFQMDYRLRRFDGEYRWIVTVGKPRFTRDGMFAGFIGSCLDISDRKLAEEKLRQSEIRNQAIVSAIPDLMVRINREGYYLDYIPAKDSQERISSDRIGKPLSAILPAELVPTMMHYIERALGTGKVQLFEQQLRVNGNTYEEEVRVAVSGNNEVLAMIRDVTKRKQAEIVLQQALHAAEAANRAKSLFLSKMSHELRTPLNAILGFTQMLAYDPSLSAEHLNYINIINRSGEHLLNLINDILSMSKIEAGQVTLKENCFDLYRLLESLEQMLQFKAKSKGLQLTFIYDSKLPQYVCADESKLRQILINLLGNAIKFTQEGRVTLRVSRGAGEQGSNSPFPIPHSPVRLSLGSKFPTTHRQFPTIQNPMPNAQCPITFTIEDTGPGIAPSELYTLFEPFIQTETGRQSMEGTGLGLPISQQFARLMGGEITVTSTLGEGATFTVTIPVSLAEAMEEEAALTQGRAIGLAPEQPTYRILVVEDIAENRQLLVKLLEPLGFVVRQATNGREAVAVWESWSPHLIWMDIVMPVMDGYEATRQIKQLATRGSNSRNPVIIALTASVFDEQRSAILAAGCDDFLPKPFRQDALLEKMAHHLGVRYLYEQPQPSSASPSFAAIAPPTSEELAVMPLSWRQQFHQAALYADEELMNQLIEQIPEEYGSLYRSLKALIENFQLEQIINITASS